MAAGRSNRGSRGGRGAISRETRPRACSQGGGGSDLRMPGLLFSILGRVGCGVGSQALRRVFGIASGPYRRRDR